MSLLLFSWSIRKTKITSSNQLANNKIVILFRHKVLTNYYCSKCNLGVCVEQMVLKNAECRQARLEVIEHKKVSPKQLYIYKIKTHEFFLLLFLKFLRQPRWWWWLAKVVAIIRFSPPVCGGRIPWFCGSWLDLVEGW